MSPFHILAYILAAAIALMVAAYLMLWVVRDVVNTALREQRERYEAQRRAERESATIPKERP